MQRHLFIFGYALILLIWSISGHGAQVRTLYESKVPVLDKEQETRNGALGAALRQVVVKVSGQGHPEFNDQIRIAMGKPGRFVQQFRYELQTLEPIEEGVDSLQELQLWTRFDKGAVDALLTEAGLPIWGQIRPEVLVWLKVDGELWQGVVAEQDTTGLANVLTARAHNRGIPLLFPLLDLEDQGNLSRADLWAGFQEQVMAVSQRYASDAVLVGQLSAINELLWEGRWRLYIDGVPYDFRSAGESHIITLADGMQEAADIIASRYARVVLAGTQTGVDMRVTGVRSLGDYGRILTYLQSLEGVNNVAVVQVSGDQVMFQVSVSGGIGALAQVIALGRTLVDLQIPDEHRFQLLP